VGSNAAQTLPCLILLVAVFAFMIFLMWNRRRRAKQRAKEPPGWTPPTELSKWQKQKAFRNMYKAQKRLLKHKDLIDNTTELVLELWALNDLYRSAGKKFTLDSPPAVQLLDEEDEDVSLVAAQQYDIGPVNCSRKLLNPALLEDRELKAQIKAEMKAEFFRTRTRKKPKALAEGEQAEVGQAEAGQAEAGQAEGEPVEGEPVEGESTELEPIEPIEPEEAAPEEGSGEVDQTETTDTEKQ
jgi:hypothetical protein